MTNLPVVTTTREGDIVTEIDKALVEEWKALIEKAAVLYHDITDVDQLDPNTTDPGAKADLRKHQAIVHRLAVYFTTHEMDYLDTKGYTCGLQVMWRTDEVDDELIARYYHFMWWQSCEYDIWVK